MKENKFVINRKKFSINKKAFSLVEVLLAIVLLAIIATPILSVFYTSMSLNLKSRELMAATDVSTGIIESIEKGDGDTFRTACNNKNFAKYPFINGIYVSGESTCAVSGNTITFNNLKYKKNGSGNTFYIFDVKVYITDVNHDSGDTYWVNNIKVEVYKNNASGETAFTTANLSDMSGSVINID